MSQLIGAAMLPDREPRHTACNHAGRRTDGLGADPDRDVGVAVSILAGHVLPTGAAAARRARVHEPQRRLGGAQRDLLLAPAPRVLPHLARRDAGGLPV